MRRASVTQLCKPNIQKLFRRHHSAAENGPKKRGKLEKEGGDRNIHTYHLGARPEAMTDGKQLDRTRARRAQNVCYLDEPDKQENDLR